MDYVLKDELICACIAPDRELRLPEIQLRSATGTKENRNRMLLMSAERRKRYCLISINTHSDLPPGVTQAYALPDIIILRTSGN